MESPPRWSSRQADSYTNPFLFSSTGADCSPPVTYFPRHFCRACHRPIHVSGDIIGECLVICISTHQTKSKWTSMLQELPEPVLIPARVNDYTVLFDDLWFDFQELKDMNENQRQRLSSKMKDRGALKLQAPLPWLLYKQRDGQSGQTRNQENYNQMWETCIKDGHQSGLPVRFLTVKKSELAENAGRSRLSNNNSRSWNLFTPIRTSSWSSSDCESPSYHFSTSIAIHQAEYIGSKSATTKSPVQTRSACIEPISPPESPSEPHAQLQGYIAPESFDRTNTPESWDEDSVDGLEV